MFTLSISAGTFNNSLGDIKGKGSLLPHILAMLLNPRYVTATSSSSGSTPTKHFVRHRRSKQRRGKLVNIGPGKSGSKVAELGIKGVKDISRNTISILYSVSLHVCLAEIRKLNTLSELKAFFEYCKIPRNLVDTFIRDPTA